VSSSIHFNLTILHTNDIHSHFEETNVYGYRCRELSDPCYGGFARLVHQTREIRQREPNSIYIDGGDLYQGTVWYSIHKWRISAHFANLLNLTAMSLGNHEFDDGIDGLLPFLDAVNFPVLASNIQTDREPEMVGKTAKSVVIEVGGRKIGIIGYTYPEAQVASNTGSLLFTDEIEAINNEAEILRNRGVNILIALGHSGYSRDLEIARYCPYIDVVVGAHSHSLLWNGAVPSIEKAEGSYPTMIKQNSGRNVPVVQAYAFGKYLGNLQVVFNDHDEVVAAFGEPILLNRNIPQDAETLQLLEPWRKEVEAEFLTEVGRTHVFLDGERSSCGISECNLGNLVADSLVNHFIKFAEEDEWSKASIAFVNAGGLRGSIDERYRNGSITFGDVLTVSPFNNPIDLIEITGQTLKDVFEHSVSKQQKNGGFLQISGIQITFNISRPIGDRVTELMVRCRTCRVPTYEPLRLNDTYQLVTYNYLIEGGDGYSTLKENIINRTNYGVTSYDVIIEYLQQSLPFTIGLERRIRFIS